jgi:hypothetical protein
MPTVTNQAGDTELDRRVAEWPPDAGKRPDTLVPDTALVAPATAVVGGADLTLTAQGPANQDPRRGTGYPAGSVIVFNGGAEPTARLDDDTLTTTVRPSTASGPATVPVVVRTPTGIESDPLDFTFTATG